MFYLVFVKNTMLFVSSLAPKYFSYRNVVWMVDI